MRIVDVRRPLIFLLQFASYVNLPLPRTVNEKKIGRVQCSLPRFIAEIHCLVLTALKIPIEIFHVAESPQVECPHAEYPQVLYPHAGDPQISREHSPATPKLIELRLIFLNSIWDPLVNKEHFFSSPAKKLL